MNAARLGVLVLAVVAAGLAALLARSLVSSNKEAPAEQVQQVPTTEILVAATDLERGAALKAGDFRWQAWPQGAAGANLIVRAQQPDAADKLAGRLARAPIANGEPITEAKLVDLKNGGFMSALIGPGMRAVAVPISPETGVGGFILPNDHVDVVLTYHQREQTNSEDVVKSETILHNVHVLAIDQRFKEEGGEQVAIGKTATLELSAKQVEVLALSQAQGTISLSLRGLAGADQQANEDDAAKSDGSIVRVVRYGAEKSIRVR